MLALCWFAAMLQTDTVRSYAAHGTSGSVAPALQRATASVLGLSQENFLDSIAPALWC